MNALPKLERLDEPLTPAPGEIPSPANPPPGCKFQTRCPHAVDICRSEEPRLEHFGLEHDVACHRWSELAETPVPA